MHNCKDCKWWVVAKDGHGDDTKYHTCDSPKAQTGYVPWDTVEDDGVLIEDDEGWGWIVGPEFGCVHFEPRE